MNPRSNEIFYSYLSGGLSLVPCGKDKRPVVSWKEFQERQPTADELSGWLSSGVQSFAAVCGRVSGGLEIIDFDDNQQAQPLTYSASDFFDAWREEVGALADEYGVVIQRTGGGGYQVAYRCPRPSPNQKLAWVPDETQEHGRSIAIETRGEGGFAIVAPSLHPSGNYYRMLAGDFANVPMIPQEIRDRLIGAAKRLDLMPYTSDQIEAATTQHKQSTRQRYSDQTSVIETYNERYQIADVLSRAGYTRGRHGRYSRPGKDDSLGVVVLERDNVSFHWSSNDPLHKVNAGGNPVPRDPFAVFCMFDHGGDVREAVKDAAKILGLPGRPQAYTNGQSKPPKVDNPFESGQTRPAVQRRSYAQLLAELKEKAIQTYDEQFTIDCLFSGEEGDARLLDYVLKDNVVYDHAEDLWYWYNNLFWEPDRTLNIHQLTSDVLSDVYKHLSVRKHAESIERERTLLTKEDATPEEKDELKKVITTSKTAKARSVKLNEINEVKRVLIFACSGLRLGTTGEQWDTNIELLGVQNGVISLVTGLTVDPAASQYIRTVAPVYFAAAARCHLWEKSLLEIFDGNAENVAYVRRLLGYAMSGTCVESDFPIWFGKDGRNGKEFILERIRNVLGDKLAGVAESELLLRSKSDRGKNSATEALMVLRGRRIAWASETNEGKQMDLASMKDLSGGHLLTGRQNFGHQVEWKRTHTIILLTNHKPHVNSQALAEWDRIRLLEFPLSFVNEPDLAKPNQRQKDKTLGERIDASELAGILNWLIAGCLEWRSGGLQEPESVKQATEQYRQDEDTLGHFIRECCFVGAEAKCRPAELYRTYVAWVDPGAKPMGKKTFYTKIEEMGHKRGAAMGYEWFYGLGVKIEG